MSDPLTDIPDAVAAALNAAVAANVFAAGVAFAAVRKTIHQVDLTQSQNLLVLVACSGYTKTALSRRDCQWNVNVDVVTTKAVADKENATLDPLMDMVRTMASKSVLEKNLSSGAGEVGSWIETVSQPHFSGPDLMQKNRFLSRTTFTYFTVRRR